MIVRTWWKRIGFTLLMCIIVLSLCVKYGWFPIPEVQAAEVKSHYIEEVFYEFAVPNEAILGEEGEWYIYTIQSNDHYWLDGQYAYKTTITIIAQNDTVAAISITDSNTHAVDAKKVVLHPSSSFSDVQKIRVGT